MPVRLKSTRPSRAARLGAIVQTKHSVTLQIRSSGMSSHFPPSVCAEFSYIIPYVARATGCIIVVVDLDVHPGG